MIPLIFGLSRPHLLPDEAAFFKAASPAGFILFARNIESPEQVLQLTDSLRACVGRDDLAILIDQEGGRVRRLNSPIWPEFPCAADFGVLYSKAPMTAIAAAQENARAMGTMLASLGITINCAPVLDVRTSDTHNALGDRSFGDDPNMVAALGRATLDGLAAGGLAGVIKHIPGQGRAATDSHLELPRVNASAEELERDLVPFTSLTSAPAAMVAHVLYSAWDADRPATQSSVIIQSIIREKVGFKGLLFSDDIIMQALSGSMEARALACLDAGIDIVLHCNGDMNEMRAIAAVVPRISDHATERLDVALSTAKSPGSPEILATALARRDALMAMA